MCGINGITDESKDIVRLMSEATAHRGPDATGFFSAPDISFAHNRLSVIDLSLEANQPMHSDDKRFTITYNGEIYNYKELRTELSSQWHFKTEGDTEVLLAACVTWGSEVTLNKLKGIFAFALWDADSKELLVARDHMGVKPLYYAIKEGVLYFSSELGGVIAGTGYRTLSKQALSYYISLNYVPSPYTLVEGISKLEPAHMLTYKNGQLSTKRYWTPSAPAQKMQTPDALRGVIGSSVKRQLVSDRPLGVFLSGGLDSSIVLHHTADHVEKARTFSVDFEMVKGAESEAGKFNSDAELASKTAAIYGADHTTFTLSLSDVRESFDAALSSLDEPISNPTTVSQYLLSKWVREKGVVVALGGDGGDELFGGYTRHRIALGASYVQSLPELLQIGLGNFSSTFKKLSIPLGVPLHLQVLALKPSKYNGLFNQSNMLEDTRSFFEKKYADSAISTIPAIDQFMRVDRESWLCDESLSRTDRTSMAFGLEARVPLLDIDVVNFADTMMGHKKFKPWSNKKILRDAYRGYLPEYLFNQPKRGWISPGAKWFRDPVIKAYVQEVLSPDYYQGLNALFNWDAVQKQFDAHIESREYHLYPLWNILQLQVWAKKYKIML